MTIDVTLGAGTASSGDVTAVDGGVRLAFDDGWLEFALPVAVAGRYRCELTVVEEARADGASAWVEDYVGNPDGRTYDITGPMPLPRGGVVARDGSPLDVGSHRMRLHCAGGPVTVRSLRFTLLREHAVTLRTSVQRTDGSEWVLVWSDEFERAGHPDPERWTSDLGNWGWGNREPQYYTEGRLENARVEDGHLVIEARPGDLGQAWTSARLTTRGKISFQYGRIEIRARVPAADGTWAAGWLLGDAYRDELSWPYCGEIDVMEAVGREVDDASGDGINHASCHTRAYYFKQGNHISSTIPVRGMSTGFHVYTLDWEPDAIRMSCDGEHYYTYDKTESPLSWPFDRPQNLILNLAMGGGMGGPIAAGIGPQRLLVDYVRVYERR